MILSMYNTFTPEIKIEPAQGKTFVPNKDLFKSINKDPRIVNYTEVLQEKALVRYGSGQFIGLVKGVSDNFLDGRALDSSMLQGHFTLKRSGEPYAVIGSAVQSYLSVNVNDHLTSLEIYSPRKGSVGSANPTDEFNVRYIRPSGVFEVQKEFDEMIVVPLSFARDLLGNEAAISSVEINVKNIGDVPDLQEEIRARLGKSFVVKNRIEQDQGLYKTLNTEKWAVYLILTFVLIIAIFNIIGSLTMLVIDKKKDIAILSSIGAGSNLIKNIFFTEGMMITMFGCVFGITAGFLFSLAQQHFGMFKMGEVNMLIEAYPVAFKWTDFVLVFVTVNLISVLASAIASRLSVKHLVEMKGDL